VNGEQLVVLGHTVRYKNFSKEQDFEKVFAEKF
jgi:hypothetical protein